MPFDPEKLDEAVDAFVAATERFDYAWDSSDDYRDLLFGDARRILGYGVAHPARRPEIDAAVVTRLRERWAASRAVERRMAASAPRRPRRGAPA